MPDTNRVAAPSQKVVVVNGNTDVLDMLEPVLEAGRYDMVFVDAGGRAYAEIKKVSPDLVVLCARFEKPDAFQLLTMLKLDEGTRDIPVLTCTADWAEPDTTTIAELADDEVEAVRMGPPPRMT